MNTAFFQEVADLLEDDDWKAKLDLLPVPPKAKPFVEAMKVVPKDDLMTSLESAKTLAKSFNSGKIDEVAVLSGEYVGERGVARRRREASASGACLHIVPALPCVALRCPALLLAPMHSESTPD